MRDLYFDTKLWYYSSLSGCSWCFWCWSLNPSCQFYSSSIRRKSCTIFWWDNTELYWMCHRRSSQRCRGNWASTQNFCLKRNCELEYNSKKSCDVWHTDPREDRLWLTGTTLSNLHLPPVLPAAQTQHGIWSGWGPVIHWQHQFSAVQGNCCHNGGFFTHIFDNIL